jgi:hypothetical protein
MVIPREPLYEPQSVVAGVCVCLGFYFYPFQRKVYAIPGGTQLGSAWPTVYGRLLKYRLHDYVSHRPLFTASATLVAI